MRVPNRTVHETMQQAMQTSYGRLVDAQRQLSTGKRLNKLSDAPADAIGAARLRGQEHMSAAHTAAADDGLAMLATQDAALQQASTLLLRARELLVAGGSDIDGTIGAPSIAAELAGIRDQLVTLANTTYDGRAVFGGFSPSAVTAVGGAVTFTGDAADVERRVGPDLTVRVNTNGADVFGFTAGDSVFALLNRVAANVTAGDTAAVRADLDVLDARHRDVTNALSSIGGRTNQLEQARDMSISVGLELAAARSLIEDVDLGAAAVRLKDAEAAYEATLAVIARMHRTSLLDFLR